MYLNLNAELLDKIEEVKQPYPSVIPDIQASFKDGYTQTSRGVIVTRFFFNSFSLKEDKKVKNLAFLLGKTILPLNNKHIKYIFVMFCTTNLCVFCLTDCFITFPKPKLSLM